MTWTRKAERAQGEKLDDHYRLWWGENMPHVEPMVLPLVTAEKDPNAWQSQLVGYSGMTAEALRSIIDWVEKGVEPDGPTAHRFTDQSQVVLSSDPAERGGPQPVVTMTVNGGEKATVRIGDEVTIVGTAELPPGKCLLASTQWDVSGRGEFHSQKPMGPDCSRTVETFRRVYETPGAYFVGFKAGSHRFGPAGKGPAIENIARCRVVVTA